MSDQVIRSAAKPFPVRAALPSLVGAGVYVLLLTLGQRLLNDPDSYSHIAVGRWIIAHGAVPASDPFSFSMVGAISMPYGGRGRHNTTRIGSTNTFRFGPWPSRSSPPAMVSLVAISLSARPRSREGQGPGVR